MLWLSNTHFGLHKLLKDKCCEIEPLFLLIYLLFYSNNFLKTPKVANLNKLDGPFYSESSQQTTALPLIAVSFYWCNYSDHKNNYTNMH